MSEILKMVLKIEVLFWGLFILLISATLYPKPWWIAVVTMIMIGCFVQLMRKACRQGAQKARCPRCGKELPTYLPKLCSDCEAEK